MKASHHPATVHITAEVHRVLQAHRRVEAILLQAVQATVQDHQAADTAEVVQEAVADTAEAVQEDADKKNSKLT